MIFFLHNSIPANIDLRAQGHGAISRADLALVFTSLADLVGVTGLGRSEEILDRIFQR